MRTGSLREKRTYHIERPFGNTLGISFIFLLALMIGFEIIARTSFVRTHVNAPSYGSRHDQFESQLARLDMVVERDGPVDCIFLGSSLVWLGIEPVSFSRSFKTETGKNIRCFTFGVSAMPANAAGSIARILIEDYHPKLLVYGLSARDMAISGDSEDSTVLLDTPWVKYRNGRFTVKGWLFEHIHLLRYKAALRTVLNLDFRPLEGFGSSLPEMYGYLPKTEEITPKSMEVADEYARKWLYDVRVYPENISGLEEYATLNNSGTQILAIEMPVPSAHFAYFKNGKQDFGQIISRIAGVFAASEILFWRATHVPTFPPEAWWDSTHLSAEGAVQYSEWLGEQVGQAVNGGQISFSGAGNYSK